MDSFLIIFLSSVLVVCAVQDLRFKKIPNLLTYPTMAVALGYHSIKNGVDGLVFSTAGLMLGTAVFIIPYIRGGMGAGDAKMMGAVGAVLGARGVLLATVFSVLIGGIYALILLLSNSQYLKGFITRYATTLKTLVVTGQFISIPVDEKDKEPKLCFGVAIALGTFICIFLELSGHNFVI